jgi:hypothetical protein
MDWVKRKGLAGVYQAKTYNITTRKASKIVRKGGKATRDFEDFGVAFLILRKILKKGINPHPFLIPSYESEKPNLINKIETIFKNIKLK